MRVISLNGSKKARRRRKFGPRACYCYHCTGDVYEYKCKKDDLAHPKRHIYDESDAA